MKQGRYVRFRLDCGVIFMVDFSDLRGIRSFSRYLLGFLMVGEWREVILGWIIMFLG